MKRATSAVLDAMMARFRDARLNGEPDLQGKIGEVIELPDDRTSMQRRSRWQSSKSKRFKAFLILDDNGLSSDDFSTALKHVAE